MRADSAPYHCIQRAFVRLCTIPSQGDCQNIRSYWNISTVTSRRELAIITPISPSPTGNGLAMRASLFLAAARRDFAVKVLVVPVAGQGAGTVDGSATVLPLTGHAQMRRAVTGLLASPRWRGRLTAACPLPYRARLAPATLAAAGVSA